MLIYFYLIYKSIIIVIYLYTALLFRHYISIIWFIFNNLLPDIWHIKWTLGLNWKIIIIIIIMSLTPPFIIPINPNLTPLYHHLLAFKSLFSCLWKLFLIYHNFLSLPFSLLSCDCENVKDMKLLKVIHRNKIINNHLLISLSLSMPCKQCCDFFFLFLFDCPFATNKELVGLFSFEKPKLGLKVQ